MKGKMIAAVAAAVCIVPIAYTLTTGHSTVSIFKPDKPLFAENVEVPTTSATEMASAPTVAATIVTASDHATSESALFLASDSEVASLEESSAPPQTETTFAHTTTHEPVSSVGDGASPSGQVTLEQRYATSFRSASVMSPSRASSAGVPEFVAAEPSDSLPLDESMRLATEVGADVVADLTVPVSSESEEAVTDYVPIVSALSPALDHVLPNQDLTAPEPTSVPVPATLALLGFSLLAAGATRRISQMRR